MLCLRRKTGQRIKIGPDIWVAVLDVGDGTVKLGISAPDSVLILREEVIDRHDGKRESDGGKP